MSRNLRSKLFATAATLVLVTTASRAAEPLEVDPENPHYLMYRGHSVVLIGSSEHYGAVMNTQFDYHRYLDTLQANGLNISRLFTGQYHERPGKFGILPSAGFSDFEIAGNSLAPEPASYLTPWLRTDIPGAVDGGRKFDLMRWNTAYFHRLKDYISEANRRGIVVELSLFSNYYVDVVGERFWEVSPWNSRNNVNDIGAFSGGEALTLKHERLVAIQDALVRKIVQELHGFDNIYYEICNEPYGSVPLDWQRHIAETIQAAEARYPLKHLIVQEIGLGGEKGEERLPQASVIAYHNSEGEAVTRNYGLDIPVIHNETIFDYSDAANRVAAWRFLLSGGAMYLGADYSFTVGHEDGSFIVPPHGAGGGSLALRRELEILRSFMEGLPYTKMTPQPTLVQSGLPRNAHAYTLTESGKTYAVYLYHGSSEPLKGITVDESPHQLSLVLNLPSGRYAAKWLDPATGAVLGQNNLIASSGGVTVHSPSYSGDVALDISSVRIE